MNDWKFIPTIMVATVLIFGAGVFTGGMLVDYVKQPHGKSAKRGAGSPPGTNASLAIATNAASTNAPAIKPARAPEFLSKEFLQRLDADLKLTKEQHETVKKIIEDGQNSVRKAVQDARLEIREALTPAQQKAFDELVKRPFRKPLFETNTTFQARLNQILIRQTNAAAEAGSPEAQVVWQEAQRAKALNAAQPGAPVLPPPTNLPAQ